MKIISSMFNNLPKRLAVGALIFCGIALPMAVSAAQTVTISATTGVANVTAGNTTYASSVNAAYDQVVKVEVTYDNTEAPGSNLNANNVNVKVNIPTAPQKNQVITTTTGGDNTNVVNGQATVNLDRSDAYLQYIPGSAQANITNTDGSQHLTAISDNIVYGTGYIINNGNPCQAASVAVEAREIVPGVKIVKQVEKSDQTNAWTSKNSANPGDTLKYLISYQNTGNSVENQVIIRDNLPPKMTLVPGTTYAADATNPSGIKVSDDVTQGGIDLGNFGAGATAYVTFQVKVPAADQLSCGANEFRNVGVVHPQNMDEYYNTADTDVNRQCQNVTTPTCDQFTVTPGSNQTATVSNFQTTGNGATLTNVVINWGDTSTPLTTNTPQGQTHQYSGNGPYTVTATAHFNDNGKDVTATSGNCTQPVNFAVANITPPASPTSLVNTGPGSSVGIFVAVTVMSALGYRWYLGRRVKN